MNTPHTVLCFPGSKALFCTLITLGLAGQASALREWDANAPARTVSEDNTSASIPRSDYFWAQQSHADAGVDRWKAGQQTHFSAGGNSAPASGNQLAPGIAYQEKALTTEAGGNGIIIDTNYGHRTSSNLTNVPEPGTRSLLGFGLFFLFARHKILAPQQ